MTQIDVRKYRFNIKHAELSGSQRPRWKKHIVGGVNKSWCPRFNSAPSNNTINNSNDNNDYNDNNNKNIKIKSEPNLNNTPFKPNVKPQTKCM